MTARGGEVMEAMTLERAQARANEIEDAICRGKMDVYQVFTQMRQLIPSAHLAQPAQAVDVTDAMVARARAAFIKELKRGRYCGETSDGEHDRAMKAALTRALSVQKAGPVDGWTARRDDELRLWWVYSPSGDAAGIYDQAAGVHAELLRQLAQSLPASPTPDKEGA